MTEYTSTEMMISAAANYLHDDETAFVGIGAPMLACNLAKATHAPNLEMVYESGIIGAPMTRGGVPASIADPKLVSESACIYPMHENFSRILQGGEIDVGFLGGAQIDRWGNINSTAIGDYNNPDIRFPGSGGACEIACNSKRFIIITSHEKRRFPEEVDFVTSPGYINSNMSREDLGLQGGGPSKVITDKAIMGFDESGEMRVEKIHPNVSREDIESATSWNIKFQDNFGKSPVPSEKDITLLRETLDPDGQYI